MAAVKEQAFQYGTLLLLAVLANIAFGLLHLPSVGPVLPFAVLAAALYGRSYGFLTGLVGYGFSDILLYQFSPLTFVHAIAAGIIAAGIGNKGTEHNLVPATLLAVILFEAIVRFYNANFLLQTGTYAGIIPSVALHFVASAIIALILAGYWRNQ